MFHCISVSILVMMASLGMCLSLRDCFGICHGFFLLECANTTLSEALSSGYFIEMPKGGGSGPQFFVISRNLANFGNFWQHIAIFCNFPQFFLNCFQRVHFVCLLVPFPFANSCCMSPHVALKGSLTM